MRKQESGQVIPLVAVGLMAGAILVAALARVAVRLQERTAMQTAVDATALSSATAYSRGLNIAAESNNLLMMAAGTDAILKLCGVGLLEKAVAKIGLKAGGKAVGAPTSFTEMVTKFQDAFLGSMPGRPAVVPLMMGAATISIGTMNGLQVIAFYNGKTGVDGLLPDLNLRRASVADLAMWAGSGGNGRVAIPGREKEDAYSYQDRKTGQRVFVRKEDVESIQVKNPSGGTRPQFRLREKDGELAGKFVKKDKITGKVADFLDIPRPLLDRTPIHEVLVVGIPWRSIRPGLGQFPVASRADSSGGAVFNGLGGTANYESRLIKADMPGGELAVLMAVLSSPDGWRLAVSQAVSGGAISLAGEVVQQLAFKRMGGV